MPDPNDIELPPVEDHEVTPAKTQELIDKKFLPIRLIDCREEDEFAICRIDGALLLPLSSFKELSIASLGDDLEWPTIIYCHHGMRSMQATLFLRERGFKNVWSMSGGIDEWSRSIDPEVPRY